MTQFDVHRNVGRNRTTIPYVVVVQSSLFKNSRRRVVVPLVSAEEIGKVATLPMSAVNPVFTVEGVLFEQSVDELSEVNEIIELRVGRFPLPRGKKSASTDCPNTTVEGVKVVLNPFEIVSVPVDSLGDRLGSLAGEADAIVAALDELFSRAWD
jgi:toxin CcdB